MKAIKLAAATALFALAASFAYADDVATCTATISADTTIPASVAKDNIGPGCKCMIEKASADPAQAAKVKQAIVLPAFADRMAVLGADMEPMIKECFKF